MAHGEGKFVPADEAVRAALWDEGRVALTYAPGDNPNGSVDDIAVITDATGLVLGLMPHPERHVSALQHPAWARRRPAPTGAADGPGLRLFINAVRQVNQGVARGV